MKKHSSLWVSLTLILLVSCDLTLRTYRVPGSLPVLTTSKITAISQNSAIGGGAITTEGLNSPTVCGVCWSTNLDPTFDDNKTIQKPETGSYTSYITGLTGSTTYFVRSYATTCDGTSYGDACQFTTDEATPTVTDVDGNVYHTVQIGTQLWMAENLRTTKYNDGTPIPILVDYTSTPTPGYCWFLNDSIAYKKTYGALYNWYAVNTGKLAPIGWHVPTNDEWIILSNFLGGDAVSGGKLKSTIGWKSPNTGATNSSGFSGLPGGFRNILSFGIAEYYGYWWSATECDAKWVWDRHLSYNDSLLVRDYDLSHSQSMKNFCSSVRCVKD